MRWEEAARHRHGEPARGRRHTGDKLADDLNKDFTYAGSKVKVEDVIRYMSSQRDGAVWPPAGISTDKVIALADLERRSRPADSALKLLETIIAWSNGTGRDLRIPAPEEEFENLKHGSAKFCRMLPAFYAKPGAAAHFGSRFAVRFSLTPSREP